MLFIGWKKFSDPFWNWDMLPYMAGAAEIGGLGPVQAHDTAYAEAARHLPPDRYGPLLDPNNSYRVAMHTDPGAFADQLPFYWVKPLYIAAVWAGWRLGAALTRATVWPSLIGFLLIAAALFDLLRRDVSTWLAAIATALFCALPCVNEVAGLSTPDALSAGLLLLAIAQLTRSSGRTAGVILLALAIAARADNGIVAVLLLALQPWYGGGRRLGIRGIGAGAVLLVLTYLFVDHLSCAHGWCVRPSSSFLPRSLHPDSEVVDLTLARYLEALRKGTENLHYTWVLEFASLEGLAVVLTVLAARRAGPSRTWRIMALITLAALIRYLFFPVPDDRALIPWFATIAATFVTGLFRLLQPRLLAEA